MCVCVKVYEKNLPSLRFYTINNISDLILRIMEDAKGFDTRIWIAAVGIVMGTLVILTCGTCIVLYKECKESPGIKTHSDYY